jgi:hypothetical protein
VGLDDGGGVAVTEGVPAEVVGRAVGAVTAAGAAVVLGRILEGLNRPAVFSTALVAAGQALGVDPAWSALESELEDDG